MENGKLILDACCGSILIAFVMSAYRSGYNKAHSEHVKRITNIVELKLSDIDSPVFTHTKEFREHFDYIMSKIKKQFA